MAKRIFLHNYLVQISILVLVIVICLQAHIEAAPNTITKEITTTTKHVKQ